MENRTFIGIDYGDRRIGLARSDLTGLIASPLKTITVKSFDKAVDEIIAISKESDSAGMVIGYPVSATGGSQGESCQKVDRFIKRLEKKYTGPIYRVDERYSSVEAEDIVHLHNKKTGQDKSRLDRMAAAIILQRFLDERRNEKD